jgi:[ribosomal protein S18]-alanine N-acetyltransferase
MTVPSHAVSITAAHREDLPAVLALERAGFAQAEQWSERSWTGELLGEGRTVLLARAEQVLGVVAFRTIGEHADLHRLVVAPRHRRAGLGTALVEAGLEAVRHLGARAVLLEVDYDNEAAIALYQHLGFEQLSARRNYYGPGQDALILKLYDLQDWPARYAAQLREEAEEQRQDATRPRPVGPGQPAGVTTETEEPS